MRCVRTGRECPGYEPTDVATSTPSTSLRQRSASVTPSVTQGVWQTETEWRAFQYFRECTAHQFQSFWPEDIWTDSISQVAHQEPGIRYALLALAGFHERYERNDGVSTLPNTIASKHDWALIQYNNAIGSFLTPRHDGPVDINVYLLSCVIFTAIESMRGNSASAIHLVRQGVRMLNEAKATRQNAGAQKSQESSIPLKAIENIFLRWEIQIQELMSDLFGDKGYDYSYQIKDAAKGLPGAISDLPDTNEQLHFGTVREAREVQDRYWHGLITHLNQLDLREDDQVNEDRAKVLGAYFHISTNLDVAFQDLADRTSASDASPADIRGIQVMKMWRLVFQASLANPDEESAQSPVDADAATTLSPQDQLFEEIVDLAESLLLSASQTTYKSAVPPPPIVPSKKWASLATEANSPPKHEDQTRNDSISTTDLPESRHDSLASDTSRACSTSADSTPEALSTPRPSLRRQRSSRQASAPQYLPATFSPDIAMLPTLFGSFLRGTDAALRRRVINILKTCRRQEGLWDSRLFARICERILELEAETAADRAAEHASRVSTTNSSREVSADAEVRAGADVNDANPFQTVDQPDHDIEMYNDSFNREGNAWYEDPISPGHQQTQHRGLGLDILSDDEDAIDRNNAPDSPATPEGAIPNLRALGVFRLDPPDVSPALTDSPDPSQPMPNMRALGSYSLVPDEIDEDKGGRKTRKSKSREASQEADFGNPQTAQSSTNKQTRQDSLAIRARDGAKEGGESTPTQKKPRPAGWGKRNGGKKVTGVKIGLGAEGLGRQRLRIGFIFDGGRGVREEGLEVTENGDWVLSGKEE
ncbi:hypothetical protein BDZ85DRAFT_90131 [Elsinoe ampelina]|uniref:Transcription factor domain-containing protein n=1 Tax=Elsinoe ampelina TaxID=302913 RepID=A0A6A6GHV3_9PEZI|nr:hypothetical protein BDZ85DRAFT_90131 [Elsinoe ampelina]